jgi:hypothetical protein
MAMANIKQSNKSKAPANAVGRNVITASARRPKQRPESTVISSKPNARSRAAMAEADELVRAHRARYDCDE